MDDIYGDIPRLLYLYNSSHKAIPPMEACLRFAVNVALVAAGVRPGYYDQGRMIQVRKAIPDLSVTSVVTHTTDGTRAQVVHNFYYRLGHCNSAKLAEVVEKLQEGHDATECEADINAFLGHYTPDAPPPSPCYMPWSGTWVEWRCAFDRELSSASGSFVLWREYLDGNTEVSLDELTARVKKLHTVVRPQGLRPYISMGPRD